jgi:thiol:disulfide interchange protein DsbD
MWNAVRRGRLVLCLFGWLALLSAGWAQAEDYLEPEKAFVFSAKMVDGKTVAVTYVIADGYYMYRERFKFRAQGAKLGEAKFPHGKVKFDETFNKEVETFRSRMTIEIPVEADGPFTLISTGQGCADAGLCYPPQDSEISLTPPKGAAAGAVKNSGADAGQNPLKPGGDAGKPVAKLEAGAASGATAGVAALGTAATGGAPIGTVPTGTASAGTAPTGTTPTGPAITSSIAMPPPATAAIIPAPVKPATVAPTASTAPQSELGQIQSSLNSGKLLQILPWFFLLGLGLSFTPCVLPMVPILSFIIVGEGVAVARSRSILLSITYVLGMAIVYTALGVAAGLVGEGLSAALQNRWVLGLFALLMVGLALSMFGFYQIQVPAAIQARLSQTSEHQSRGKLFGVFVMGAISALIVGPCVAAPLAGTLVFISQTRDVIIGGSALFALAIGMGVPLLLVGASAGSLLPRAGGWMESVERFFGVLMLATALWMVSPVLPGAAQVFGWAALLLGYGAFLIWSKEGHWAAKAFGLSFAILGALQLVGLVSGGRDPLAPLGHLRAEVARSVNFQRVKSVAELDTVLAQNPGRPAMLDFYADWCVSCKEMEKLTFPETAVRERLGKLLLLQVDVTANSPEDKALLKRFQLFGPPGIIFFDGQGRELVGKSVIGFQDSDKFVASLGATGLF